MSNGPNFNAKQVIFANQSKIRRLESSLEVRTGERDRAIETAAGMEQRLNAFGQRVSQLVDIYRQRLETDPTLYNAGALDAVAIVEHLFTLSTDQILNDLCHREAL